jgi:uncharacterized membrane protein
LISTKSYNVAELITTVKSFITQSPDGVRFRFLSMLVVTVMLPKLMLTLSILVCFLATIMISIEGGETANYLVSMS